VVLVSYHIVCSTYDKQETVDLVKAFEKYVVSEEGQKAAAESAKSAPISATLAAKAVKSIEAIKVKS
jgi:phosphate transport system substrate-binding protein